MVGELNNLARSMERFQPQEGKIQLNLNFYLYPGELIIWAFSILDLVILLLEGITYVGTTLDETFQVLACENSRPSSLPTRLAFSRDATRVGSKEGRLFHRLSRF